MKTLILIAVISAIGATNYDLRTWTPEDTVPVKKTSFEYVSCMQDLSIQDKVECGTPPKTFEK
jgi:hypothetical protein